MELLRAENIQKVYNTRAGGKPCRALAGVSFSVEAGEFVAIMGASGSGKSTLLNILATLDTPTSGEVFLEGQSMKQIKGKNLAAFRREKLGFVFQDFNLLDTFTVRDNILLPLVLSRCAYSVMARRLTPIAERLGIANLLNKYPYEVSGGQKQRAAVARALITEPQLVLADEPTGALDSKSADQLMRIFDGVNAAGQTILMVTHSIRAASHASRVLFIKDGQVFHQLYRGQCSADDMFQRISDTLTTLATGGVRHE